MTVSLDWLTNIVVNINTTVLQVPSFNNCMLVGVFPLSSKPSSWGTAIYKSYSSYTAVSNDFTPLITGTTLQDNRYQWLLNGAKEFFAQSPVPQTLYISQIDPSTTNYVSAFSTITTAFNNFYAFCIADQLTYTQVNQSNGIYDVINSMASAKNYKILFLDTADLGITATHFLYEVTHAGVGSPRAALFAHTNNFTPVAGGTQTPTSLAMACMSKYFTNLLNSTVGMKALSGTQLLSTLTDTAITDATLGTPGQGDGLIGVNGNVYPSFGTGGIGSVQYGLMAASTPSSLLYLDQIVGKDYLQLTVQADLATYQLSQVDVGGIPYSDVGIQNLAQVFKNSLQKSVNAGIIQPFGNSDINVVSYANTPQQDVTARIYQGLSASLKFLSRIQRVKVGVNITV